MTMTEDHYPPASTELPGERGAPEASYCGECDRHVVGSHDHAESCPHWRGNEAGCDG